MHIFVIFESQGTVHDVKPGLVTFVEYAEFFMVNVDVLKSPRFMHVGGCLIHIGMSSAVCMQFVCTVPGQNHYILPCTGHSAYTCTLIASQRVTVKTLKHRNFRENAQT
jgi:hypothetical protein